MPKEKSPQAKLLEDVKNRFKHHPATAVTGPQHDVVRADLGRLALKVAKSLPDGREKSLALTHLEEAMFWANAAIARATSSEAPATVASSGGPAKTAATPRKTAKKTTRRVTRTARS